jgi:hypothetical protein
MMRRRARRVYRMIIMVLVFTVGWDWHEDKCSDDTHCKKG